MAGGEVFRLLWSGSVRDWSICVREKSTRWDAFVGGRAKKLMIPTVWRQTSAAR